MQDVQKRYEIATSLPIFTLGFFSFIVSVVISLYAKLNHNFEYVVILIIFFASFLGQFVTLLVANANDKITLKFLSTNLSMTEEQIKEHTFYSILGTIILSSSIIVGFFFQDLKSFFVAIYSVATTLLLTGYWAELKSKKKLNFSDFFVAILVMGTACFWLSFKEGFGMRSSGEKLELMPYIVQCSGELIVVFATAIIANIIIEIRGCIQRRKSSRPFH
ncbi:hypothetical protein [Alteromonas halophila]|uniref:Uncharacterized protein n=1 Tax=Alteromonas halophila TaxID=516698 RepID=A0A918JLH2_9ALTE|nr:hypothetical protein [Alteromonas halophila]GGW85040.1 hypothetical protein GCM10007391_18590 [Alteromonas halophila]